MNYILIVGVIGIIVVIGVAAYFMLGKKDEDIKDGKYRPKEGRGTFIVISKNKVELWGEENKPPPQTSDIFKVSDIDIVKSDMKVDINGDKKFAYGSTVPLQGKIIYLAQSSSGDIIFYSKEGNDLVRVPEMPNFIKVE
jgi:hypothetical protein